MKDLNDAFKGMSTGNFDFLRLNPMHVDPGAFTWMKGDKTETNPLFGNALPGKVKTRLADVMSPGEGKNNKNKVVTNKTMTVYGDFNCSVGPAFKGYVEPALHLINYGGHAVRMYYLPWAENQIINMVLEEEADFFMTASMTGCRFEVKDFGDGRIGVSHSNVQPQKNAQKVLTELLRKHDNMGHAPTVLSYGKDRYFADAQRLIGRAKHGLMPLGIRPEHVIEADVHGCFENVVGVRSGKGWRFYAQLAAAVTVDLHESQKRKRFMGLWGTRYVDVIKEKGVIMPIVLKVAEIWPRSSLLYQM